MRRAGTAGGDGVRKGGPAPQRAAEEAALGLQEGTRAWGPAECGVRGAHETGTGRGRRQSAQAALPSTTDLGLKEQTLISHSSGGWRSGIKVTAAPVPPEASVLGSQMPPLPVASRGRPCVCVWGLISSRTDSGTRDQGPPLIYLNDPLMLYPKQSRAEAPEVGVSP